MGLADSLAEGGPELFWLVDNRFPKVLNVGGTQIKSSESVSIFGRYLLISTATF